MPLAREYRCTQQVGSVHSLNMRQCARWQYHDGKCAPFMAVIGAMASLIREYYHHDEESAPLEAFAEEAKRAWRLRVIDPPEE